MMLSHLYRLYDNNGKKKGKDKWGMMCKEETTKFLWMLSIVCCRY